MKASTTILQLVWSFSFCSSFQSRRATFPARRKRSLHHPSLWKHHEGVQFVAFHHFYRCSQQAFAPQAAKGLPGVTPVHQHLLDLVEAGPVFVKHRQSPSPVG